MIKFIKLTLILLSMVELSSACTMFCASNNNLVLVGNEEDFYNYPAIVEINPPIGNKYGTIYFGFYDNLYIPFGRVNSEGLFFDVAAYENHPEIINKSSYFNHH